MEPTKVSFILTHWDDAETERNLQFMDNLSSMFDHSKNPIPDDYYLIDGNLKLGQRVKVTFEIV